MKKKWFLNLHQKNMNTHLMLNSISDNATVTVFIGELREKIENDPSNPQYIETIWGVGYRLNA